jgi:enamine deaminase RidA (YjgF/YER057c/UK114 family)
MIEPDAEAETEKQHESVAEAIRRLALLPELKGATPVWQRLFVADAATQSDIIPKDDTIATSIVKQPPLSGAHIAAWLYFVQGAKVTIATDKATIVQRPHYTHLHHTQLHALAKTTETETEKIFDAYTESLAHHNCTLEKNCVRTWIFVRDVDHRYAAMVRARGECFEREGLTRTTHYIASTGIEGAHRDSTTTVLMDAWAIRGLDPAQIRYLKAPSHLNPTHEYGVTFERGTAISYGDRRHVIISGTASIDNRGEIVHPDDVARQTARTFENIGALLHEAGAEMSDVASMVVYLRRAADHATVRDIVESRWPDIPRVMVLAPVCRPGWLVEVECMAVVQNDNNSFKPF